MLFLHVNNSTMFQGGFVVGDAKAFNGSFLVKQSVTRGTPVIFVSHAERNYIS